MLGSLWVAWLLLAGAPEGGTRQTVVYAEPAENPHSQAMDIYVPTAARDAPVLLFFHGGVWRLGDKEEYGGLGRAFAERGILTGVVNYRLVPGGSHEDQLEDAVQAVAWMLAHAKELGGDPHRLFLAGHSAGGELISSLVLDPSLLDKKGLAPSALAGVIPLSGIFDLTRPIDDTPEGGLAGYIHPVFGDDAEALVKASPQSKVGPTSVPWLVMVAGDDSVAMRAQSTAFAKALKAQGVEPRLQTVKGRGHFELVSMMATAGDPAADAIARFIRSRPPVRTTPVEASP